MTRFSAQTLSGTPRVARAGGRTWPAAAIAFPVAVLCGIAAMVYLPAGALRDWVVPASPAAVAQPLASPAGVPVGIVARPRADCAVCGVVEQIRPVENPNGPATFEFTVRMRDGSARVSVAQSADSWRRGDRIMLIGGAVVPAR